MKAPVVLSLVLLAWGSAGAGELVFTNGTRLTGELSNDALMISTGAGLVEVAPEDVVALSRGEIRLRDGRVIRGTLVGGQIKARTALGEIAVKVDELEAYHHSGPVEVNLPRAQAMPPPAAAPSGAGGVPGSRAHAPSASVRHGMSSGLPTVASYQDLPTARAAVTTAPAPTLQPAALGQPVAVPLPGRRLEVVDDSPLYRDALQGASQVGRISPGQQVTFVDSIDRRLRILNRLVFDGGHWVKVRIADGTEGWVPADSVREAR